MVDREPRRPHHLIVVRQATRELSGSGCCAGINREDVGLRPLERCEPAENDLAEAFGEVYRTLRSRFGERLEITVVEPRNMVSFIPLVARDVFRFRVPVLAALRAIGSASLSTGVLDGRLLFSGRMPPGGELVAMVADGIEGRGG
jgi:hypothetical protein